MVKRDNDPWVVYKRSYMRELLLVINQRNANLKEINGKNIHKNMMKKKNKHFILHLDKIKQIIATQFSNILFIE